MAQESGMFSVQQTIGNCKCDILMQPNAVVLDQAFESCLPVQVNNLDQWVAKVELRQRVSHRRTFFYLEQLILKHAAAKHAIRIKQMDHGIDFFFNNSSHSQNFVLFLSGVVPINCSFREQLMSYNPTTDNFNCRYTSSVDVCPICREDLICLPPRIAASLGNFGPLVVCNKASIIISLLDPLTLRQCHLDAKTFELSDPLTQKICYLHRCWSSSKKALVSNRQLVEFIVLDVQFVSSDQGNVIGDAAEYILADAQVARVGKKDTIFNVRTHLGHVLKPGDHALGYDLYGANNDNGIELVDQYEGLALPEVILVKKSYEEKRMKKRGKPRSWKLKSLNMEIDASARGRDIEEKMSSEYEEFLRDLEENPDLRSNLLVYRNEEYQPSELASMTDGEELPCIPLDELLADLDLRDEGFDNGMRE